MSVALLGVLKDAFLNRDSSGQHLSNLLTFMGYEKPSSGWMGALNESLVGDAFSKTLKKERLDRTNQKRGWFNQVSKLESSRMVDEFREKHLNELWERHQNKVEAYDRLVQTGAVLGYREAVQKQGHGTEKLNDTECRKLFFFGTLKPQSLDAEDCLKMIRRFSDQDFIKSQRLCMSGQASATDLDVNRERTKAEIFVQVERYKSIKERYRSNIEELHREIGRNGKGIGSRLEDFNQLKGAVEQAVDQHNLKSSGKPVRLVNASVKEGVAELTRDYEVALQRAEDKPTAESLIPETYHDDAELMNFADQLVNVMNEARHLHLEEERLKCILLHQDKHGKTITAAENRLQNQLSHLTQ